MQVLKLFTGHFPKTKRAGGKKPRRPKQQRRKKTKADDAGKKKKKAALVGSRQASPQFVAKLDPALLPGSKMRSQPFPASVHRLGSELEVHDSEREEVPKRSETFEIERKLTHMEVRRRSREAAARRSGGEATRHTKLPRFLVRDDVNTLAVQLTHVTRALYNMVFKHMDKISMAYLIYYALSVIFALYVAIVGTIFGQQCDTYVILFLNLYGYLNVLDCLVTFALYRFYCEAVIIVNLVAGLLNHVLLFYGILVMFSGLQLRKFDDDTCHSVPLKSAGGLIGFLGVVTILILLILYGSLITIIAMAWKAKVNRTNLIEERRNVLKGEITQVYL